jgi:hypothetical protein
VWNGVGCVYCFVDCVFAPVAFLLTFFGSVFGVVWEFMVPALFSVDCISLLFVELFIKYVV